MFLYYTPQITCYNTFIHQKVKESSLSSVCFRQSCEKFDCLLHTTHIPYVKKICPYQKDCYELYNMPSVPRQGKSCTGGYTPVYDLPCGRSGNPPVQDIKKKLSMASVLSSLHHFCTYILFSSGNSI